VGERKRNGRGAAGEGGGERREEARLYISNESVLARTRLPSLFLRTRSGRGERGRVREAGDLFSPSLYVFIIGTRLVMPGSGRAYVRELALLFVVNQRQIARPSANS